MTIRAYQNITPNIDSSVFVDESSIIIGDVDIGKDSSVWPLTAIRGDVNTIRIGDRTNIQDGSVLHVTHPHTAVPDGYALTIGNNVTIGHKVILHGCCIEDDCLIGMGVVIMDGAMVRRQVLVGAGSLVPPGKDLESGYLWLGSPVKRVRELTSDEKKWIEYSSGHYVDLKNKHMGSE